MTRRTLEHGPGLVRIGVATAARSEAASRARLSRKIADTARNAGRPRADSSAVGGLRAPIVREGWRPRSRVRMLRTYLSLDLAPLQREDGVLSLVTLTLPADWVSLAPSGAVWMRLVTRFFARLDRAWPSYGAALYKTEYQRRGAPHLHALVSAPPGVARVGRGTQSREVPFRAWVALAWADVVAAPAGQRELHEAAGTQVRPWLGDPRSAVNYWAKYVAKTTGVRHYQDQPPDEWRQPGLGLARVWSYRRLRPTLIEHPLDEREVQWAQRVLRRYLASQGRTHKVRVRRGDHRRWVNRRVRRLRHAAGGWVAVDHPARLAADLECAARIAAEHA